MARRSNRSIKASEDMARYWARKKRVEAGRGSASDKATVKHGKKRYKALMAAS
jgi:hypothetical protein